MQLTVRDAARILNVPEKTVYRWISQGEIPVHRINEQYRFNRAELLEWANARHLAASPEITADPEAGALPGLSEALRAGGVFRGIGGVDKATVLRAVVDVMPLSPGPGAGDAPVDRQLLFQVLLAREDLGSTGVGDGIAIPHVRNPIVAHVPRPSITLCYIDPPVDFGAVDGQPVHTLFTLVSPTVRAHLHLLSRLAHALRDPEFRQAIMARAEAPEVLAHAERIESRLAPTRPPSGPAKGT